MYFEKFVSSLKVDGKYLKDECGVIKIPFSTEYSIFLKNINSRDAVVAIFIDGKNILDENRLVVRANSSMELLGAMNGQEVKNKFRFIQLTKEIEDHLGYSPEDSLIKIEYWFKKPDPIEYNIKYTYTYPPYIWYPYEPWYPRPYVDNIRWVSCGGNTTSATRLSENTNSYCVKKYGDNDGVYTSDVGITVDGSECKQNFESTHVWDLESQSHVMVLRLSGYKDLNKKVETIFTTKDKIECPTCGRKNEYNDKFCSNCGTFLVK